ncbi:hypothetical protein GGR51DRAFT_522054 [Nemania sp. FL0031]|nr:hypothetical protein GGR51DRAFT_522054 [Nemania sp. FL0031]
MIFPRSTCFLFNRLVLLNPFCSGVTTSYPGVLVKYYLRNERRVMRIESSPEARRMQVVASESSHGVDSSVLDTRTYILRFGYTWIDDLGYLFR